MENLLRWLWDRVAEGDKSEGRRLSSGAENYSRSKGFAMKDMQIAGIGVGAIVTLLGLLLIWPVNGYNGWGIILTLVGLIGFGGFSKGKWY